MKDTIKNSIIGAFAIFGFVALISSSNTAPTVIHEGTPESHVWEMAFSHGTNTTEGRAYLYNKVTGEVRKYSRTWPKISGISGAKIGREFVVMNKVE
tara:strand:+ start:253 stop:543 length:291 start_codon:yes stop_codon:yes gene_type:complete